MIRPELGVFATVVSSGRASNVQKMQDMVGPCTWYVGTGEGAAYLAAGAAAVVEAGKLMPSRNAALRDAWAHNLPSLQLSDDLTKIERVYDAGGPVGKFGEEVKLSKDQYLSTYEITFQTAVEHLMDALDKTGAYYAGAAPVVNLFYINPKYPVTSASFVIGDFIIVKPNPKSILFDEELHLKEDYAMTMAQLDAYGVVARDNFIFAKFAHYDNAGGACAYRNNEKEKHACDHILTKWGHTIHGKYLKPNPRRENELMLRAPKKLDRYIMSLRAQANGTDNTVMDSEEE